MVLYKQSKTPLYRLPVWLYMRDKIVSEKIRLQASVHPKKRTWRMHHTTNNETAGCAACQMQGRAILHVKMPYQPPFSKHVCRQLNRAAKGSANARSADPSVEATNALVTVNLSKTIDCVLVLMLCADREKRRVRLEPRLDKEERRTCHGSYYARRSTAEKIDTHRLHIWVFEDSAGQGLAHRFVESEAASVEENLVDILSTGSAYEIDRIDSSYSRPDSPVDTSNTFILNNDPDAVGDTPILLDSLVL